MSLISGGEEQKSMSTLSEKLISLVLASLVFSLSGCTTTDEKDVTTPEKPDELLVQPEARTISEPKPVDDKKPSDVQSSSEAADEPVVEVIPSQANDAGKLTVEPIAPTTPAEIPPEQESAKSADQQSEIIIESSSEKAVEEPVEDSAPLAPKPGHFVITAKKKDESHPFFGKGHQMGFLVNNEPGKEIILERGKTYYLDVATDPMHDVYISLKDIGWGSTPYSDGIEGMYTYKGTITIKPDDKTPDELFYSCRNHPYMGGKIHVINPGESVQIAAKSSAASTSTASTADTQISKADVNQKIMFADMLLKSKNSQSVLKSNISDAIELHNKAEAALQSARDNLTAGNNAEAYKQADNAIAMLKKSTKMVPSESLLEQLKQQYQELLASIKDFEASHKENYDRIAKKQGKEAAVDYDKDKVAKLRASAAEFSKKGDYVKANKDLNEAQHLITVALHKMLNNQTIVYDLNFETPQEEYEYELRRFKGYEELVPIAIEQKKPAEGARKLMESFVKKGQDLKDRAIQAAKDGDFPTAIAMLQDATKDVRRGLRMIGVMQ